jgi:hypothetical protein
MKYEFGRGDLPEWAEDRISTHVDVHLDWRDRLRILVTGVCYVRAEVTVEHTPGRMESTSAATVARVVWPWTDRRGGYVTENPKEQAA